MEVENANLSRQLAEVEVLRSIYGGEGEFKLSTEEEANLESFSNLVFADDCLGNQSISFTINLLSVDLGGHHVSIVISLPKGYPEKEPISVRVECGGAISRSEHESINRNARERANELIGQESILEVVQKVQELALALGSREVDSSCQEVDSLSIVCRRLFIKRILIWFHHIKSLQKRKLIVEWGRDLNVGGYCKPGFPGILVIEGEKSDVDAYLKQLQGLRWQALSVRGEEEEEVPQGKEIDDQRHFLKGAVYFQLFVYFVYKFSYQFITKIQLVGVRELDEHGMSELGCLCREANLEKLFLCALKINR